MEDVLKVEPVAVRFNTAALMLDCGPTTVRALVKSGELQVIHVGADRRVLVESIKQFAAKQRQG